MKRIITFLHQAMENIMVTSKVMNSFCEDIRKKILCNLLGFVSVQFRLRKLIKLNLCDVH